MKLEDILSELRLGNDVPYEDKIRIAAFYSSLLKKHMLGSVAHIDHGCFTPGHVISNPQDALDIVQYFVDQKIFVKYDESIIAHYNGDRR